MTRPAGIVLSILICFSCGSQEQTYTVVMAGGIRHVHNVRPLWQDDPKISLEFVQKIGGLESGDPNYVFHRPADIAVDPSGNIYISDRRNHRVQKFDPNGKFLQTLGRKGQGPGEFTYPGELHINKRGELIVSEGESRRITAFDQDGTFLRILDFSRNAPALMLGNDEFAVLSIFALNEQEREDYVKNPGKFPLCYVYDQSGQKTGSFGKGIVPKERPSAMNGYFLAADDLNNYYVGWEARNLLEKYAPDGTLEYAADREKPFSESTEVRRLRDEKGTVASMFNRFTNNVCTDGKNRLWVESYERQYTEEERLSEFNTITTSDFISYEVYDESGILLQRIPWEYGKSRRLKHIAGNRAFFISWTDECVYEYRITKRD